MARGDSTQIKRIIIADFFGESAVESFAGGHTSMDHGVCIEGIFVGHGANDGRRRIKGSQW